MGAKGRKRKQRRKAKNRTGLIKSLSGEFSANQMQKRKERRVRESQFSKDFTDLLNRMHNARY